MRHAAMGNEFYLKYGMDKINPAYRGRLMVNMTVPEDPYHDWIERITMNQSRNKISYEIVNLQVMGSIRQPNYLEINERNLF